MFDILFAEFLVNNLRGISDSEALVKSGLAAGLGPHAPHTLAARSIFCNEMEEREKQEFKKKMMG